MIAQLLKTIPQLLKTGYTANTIVNRLAGSNTNFANQIKIALAAGYSANSILERLYAKADPGKYRTELEKYFSGLEKQTPEALSQLLNIGLATTGAIKAARMPTQKALTPQSQPPSPSIPVATQGMRETAQKLPEEIISKPKETVVEELKRRFEEPEQKVQEPVAPIRETTKAIGETKFEKDFPHLRDFVTKHLNAGKEPQEIYDLLTRSGIYKGLVKAFEDRNKVSYLQRINEIAEGGFKRVKTPSNVIERARKRQVELSKKETGQEALLNKFLDKYERDFLG